MKWFEQYLYTPTLPQKLLAYLLFPLSVVYCAIASLKRKMAVEQDFGVPIISIGNLVVGGSGKTPFVIEIAKEYEGVCVILRGYGRKSKGLLWVSDEGKILQSVHQVGDEALMIARLLPKASVIVSQDRKQAILAAKATLEPRLASKQRLIIFLDDGFRFGFKKLNILLKPKLKPSLSLCLPSGPYRENPRAYREADLVLEDGVDYRREVSILFPTPRMILATSIANPKRLESYLPKEVIGKICIGDHGFFDKSQIYQAYAKNQATSLLVTHKDAVKLEEFGLPLSLLDLQLEIDPKVKAAIASYIERF